MSPGPNQLSGEARPNVLSLEGGRPRAGQVAGRSQAATQVRPAATATAPPTARPARPARRPFGVWTLIVFAIIAFNLFRAFSDRGSTPAQTTAPEPTVLSRTVDPGQDPGSVDFGTAEDDDSSVSGQAASFTAGTPVWWHANFATSVPAATRVVVLVTRDDVVLERQTGPGDNPTDDWNGLCAGEALQYALAGTYSLTVSDSTEAIVLSKGSYDIVAAGP